MRKYALLILCFFLPIPAAAQDMLGQRDRYVRTDCPLTPADASVSYPGKAAITPYNNLIQPAGKAEPVKGRVLYILGQVFDKNCVPLKDAVIDLWQPNDEGEYTRPSREDFALSKPLFAGTGRAYSDTNGEFRFTTLYPGAYAKRAPHVHIRVTHPETKSLDTTLYFAGEEKNATDPRYKALKEAKRPLVTLVAQQQKDGTYITPTIVLDGASIYRGF